MRTALTTRAGRAHDRVVSAGNGVKNIVDVPFDNRGAFMVIAYTEATRGCKHVCSHSPVVPVYGGKFRVVSRDVVLEDVAQQVKAGARHITCGDPDFLTAPGHAVEVTKSMRKRWPALTYDVTIKIEHLLKHAGLAPQLKETGCLFVTSAVESVDDRVLAIFSRAHLCSGLSTRQGLASRSILRP
jgi:radical SAM superfamily enzyme YgiQ (UPF0313 family)